MKVVFLKTGEVKEVAEGYARNFLFKQGKAVPATAENVKKAEDARKAYTATVVASESMWASLAERLPQTTVLLSKPANTEGVLFGAVSSDAILEALKAQHDIALDAEWISHQPIKSVGQHTVTVRFPNKKETQLMITVDAQ